MSKKYHKQQVNPLNKEWENTGKATLTESDAKVLNDSTVHTGIKYVLVNKKAAAAAAAAANADS